MQNDYAQEYRDLYQNHWWWRSRERAIKREIEKSPPSATNAKILDIGCGDGLLFPVLKQYGDVFGIEPDPATLASDSPHREQIHLGYFDESYETDDRFDLIVMLDVLEHIEDANAALAKAVDLLTENGRLIITVPAFRSLWTSHDDLNHHFTRYTKESFKALAGQSGYRIGDMRYLFHWTYPAKLMIRLKENLVATVPQSPEVPTAWVNRALLGLTTLEQWTISRWGMPFGSSLLASGGKRTAG